MLFVIIIFLYYIKINNSIYHENHVGIHQSKRIESCINDDSFIISSFFIKSGNEGFDRSHCPTENWLLLMKKADIMKKSIDNIKKDYIFIDIGFNKGFNFAIWCNIFANYTKITSPIWYDVMLKSTLIKKNRYNPICGFCDDCEETFTNNIYDNNNDAENNILIIGMDINKGNVEMVNKVVSNLAKNGYNLNNVKFELIHGVGTNTSRIPYIKIPSCITGQEGCRKPDILSHNMHYDNVKSYTVDQLVIDLSNKYSQLSSLLYLSRSINKDIQNINDKLNNIIDILLIDTEGSDKIVIEGSRHLIHHQKIRCLIFEYHSLYPWNEFKLEETIKFLDKNDYECYFQGERRLWPISNTCWHYQYEFHKWSNILCVLRSDIWYHAIQPLVITKEKLSIYSDKNSNIYKLEDGKRYKIKKELIDFNPIIFDVLNIESIFPEEVKWD